MSTGVDTEEIESTRSEKLLAILLGVFLLVGTVWFYVQVPAWVDAAVPGADRASLERAYDDQTRARENGDAAESIREEKRAELDLAREEYKVALQEKRGATRARAAYDRAQTAFESARTDAQEKREAVERADAAAAGAQTAYDRDNRSGVRGWAVALIRLVAIAGWTFGSYRLIARLRRRESRYLALAFASAAVGAIMTLVFAADYVTDYIDPLDLGPFVLSVLGVAATVFAFRVLQKHLSGRLPGRRVRKGECPFCGFPLRDAGLEHGPHCAGCGREVEASCSTCHGPRRVGSSFCAACGAK